MSLHPRDQSAGTEELLDEAMAAQSTSLGGRTANFTPTPSVVATSIAAQFRRSLYVLLGFDALLYFFGTLVSLGDVSAVDLLILFIGYYGQDLYRASALLLFVGGSTASIVIDSIVLALRAVFIFTHDDVSKGEMIFFLILYGFETICKVFSINYAYKLRQHLLRVPGQSVENI